LNFKEKPSLAVLTSTFLLVTLGSVQTVDAVDYAVYDKQTCESLGGLWEDSNRCQLISMTVNENDTLKILGSVLKITHTLDNFGKIIIDNGFLINVGGNITNHDSGFIFNKERGIIANNIGNFHNEGIIKNESQGKIYNFGQGIFTNTNTGIIFNDVTSVFKNSGVFFNNNVIFNDRSSFMNMGVPFFPSELNIHELSGTNATDSFGIINNQDGGIIFNKIGTSILSGPDSELNNGNKGIIFIDTGSYILNFGNAILKNIDKFFVDCGGMFLDYTPIVGSFIEIPCN